MDRFYNQGKSREDWVMSVTPSIIDYNQHNSAIQTFPTNQPPPPIQAARVQAARVQAAPVQPAPVQPAPFQAPPFPPPPFQPTHFQPTHFQPAQFQPAQFQPAQFQTAPFQPAPFQPALAQPEPAQPPNFSILNDLMQLQLQMLNKQPLPPTNIFEGSKPQQLTSFGSMMSEEVKSISDKYNPFVEDINEDMEISDEEKGSQNFNSGSKTVKAPDNIFTNGESSAPIRNSLEVKSGSAFYQGLILYIPPFEQLSHTYGGSPALKMLYASFEFSFKMPVKIETKPRENEPNMNDATVYFSNEIISTGSGWAPHVEASVRALELLSETCYTIQAKEDYFLRCKLIDAEQMKTLNLKKWEAVSEKYPKIVEVTKESHIQKTFAVFLDSHTSTGLYEDIVCCNLTQHDVSKIQKVVEFFHLTMLPCSISTKLSKKGTPCVVSIHRYTSAKKLLDILLECGGENDKFVLHPPDTFKDFYKLHPNFWDPNLKDKPGNEVIENKTTLEDPTLQALILKPYKNVVSELFEKHKTLPKKEKLSDDFILRKAGDDFMKNTFHIDMAQSKKVAPVERMQLLLKYMEQLQEYGSRVLTSGRADMIRIYHNAIDNVRKDLDQCRKDIEKEQKEKEKTIVVKKKESLQSSSKSRSPTTKRKASPRRLSNRLPFINEISRRSASPRRKARSKSPRRHDRTRRTPSPRRRTRSPLKRSRSKSPKRQHRIITRKVRSPLRSSPPRERSPKNHSNSKVDDAHITIVKDQFRRYVDVLRRFRIEVENTPIERRAELRDRMFTLSRQLIQFRGEFRDNPTELSEIKYELEICRDELLDQDLLTSGKSFFPSDIPFDTSSSAPPEMNVRDVQHLPFDTSSSAPPDVNVRDYHHLAFDTSSSAPPDMNVRDYHHLPLDTSSSAPQDMNVRDYHHLPLDTSSSAPPDMNVRDVHQSLRSVLPDLYPRPRPLMEVLVPPPSNLYTPGNYRFPY